MTSVLGTPEKRGTKRELFSAAIKALEEKGWKVGRVPSSGKSSLRRITKGGTSKLVTIRTSQDTWIAFPRNAKNNGWKTLEEVDFVVAATVDDRHEPRNAHIHMIDGDEMRARFDRAYAARLKAEHSLPEGRGIWVSLYDEEAKEPVNRVGAGAGLKNLPIARTPLGAVDTTLDSDDVDDDDSVGFKTNEEEPLTIAEAKRRLAMAFGVKEDDVKITING